MNLEKNKLIDCCIDITSDFNISKAIHYILQYKYRYNGTKKIWEYYNYSDNNWNTDNKCKFFKNDIEILVCNEFLKRLEYWNTNKNNKNDIDYNNDCDVKITNLLLCCNKLINKKYIITIIKEARSLFEYEN